LQLLRAEAPAASDVPDGGLPAPEPLPRDGRLVLIGDFLSPHEEIRATVAAFARRGVRGHLLQILDPAEESLPFAGRVLFEGTEEDGKLLFGRTEAVRDGYRAAFAQHQQGLRDLARGVGWTMLSHRTDHAPQTALLALYLALGGPASR
jgi:uncharacterized protein (DUF58 family)